MKPPLLEGGIPILGHALELSRRPVDLLTRGRHRFGDLFSLALPGTPQATVMTGPSAQEKFFRLAEPDVSLRDVYRLMTPIFGKGIAYDATPEIMSEQLGFFHAALRESHLRAYADGFVAEANEYFEKWGDRATVDLYATGNELTIYTSSRCFLGLEFRRNLSAEFSKLYFDMEAGLSLLAFFAPNLPVPKFIRRDRARKRLGELIANIVDERRGAGKVEADFLQALMEARYTDGRALTHDEITGLILAIMFAGHHTSGVTFAWTSVLLARHQQWLAELREEQERILGDRTHVTLDDLNAMEKLGWTIKEVLRMYPPLIMLMRKVIKPFEFKGFEFAENSMVIASPAVSHRIAELFPNPDRFDPQRFSPARAEDKKHPMSWIAFGGGRHKCMGITFAQLQIKAIYSHLLRHFDFELYGDVYEPDYDRMLVGPRLPCRARFIRRKERSLAAVA